MRNKLNKNSASDQLRWVILLLAVAVILPTVCLLWFMMQAVKNERLAVRQKLVDIYKADVEKELADNDSNLQQQAEMKEKILKEKSLLDILYNFVNSTGIKKADGLVLYDSNGICIYPARWEGFKNISESENIFADAWKLEFVDSNLNASLEKFRDIENKSKDEIIKKQAQLSQARIYRKKGDIDAAIALCVKAKSKGSDDANKNQIAYLIATSQLMLTELLHQKTLSEKDNIARYNAELRNLCGVIINYNADSNIMSSISSEQRIFLANKVLELYEETKNILETDLKEEIEFIKKLAAAEELSLKISEKFPTSESFSKWEPRNLYKLPGTNAYGIIYRINSNTVFRILKQGDINSIFAFTGNVSLPDNKEKVFSSRLDCQILDADGTYIYGIKSPATKPFLKLELSKYLPAWTIELYFKNADVFENAARKQSAIYIWTGILFVLSMLLCGGAAAQAINKQAKLNKLKNDFIATVTHELKTPLSSMRVLVDTLLEGRCENQQQATDYLELISKENSRLSRLIDNFLTFSRMERNKKAFDFSMVSPVEIVNIAADAMRAKFEQGKVRFNMDVVKPLPMINADKDAMVTVLVNLLDNAYKYSNDDKQIELKVYAQNHTICFSVRDNGIGMSKRVTKKIFDRFYQADSSLSRRAEGAGLGLSIVKFIVDAHKGKIEVESKVGKGSEFIIFIYSSNSKLAKS